MIVGSIDAEGQAECCLCKWPGGAKLGERELVLHLREQHDRLLLSKEERQSRRGKNKPMGWWVLGRSF